MQKKTQVKTAKGRKVSSTHWLYRHINDPFVAMAKEEGYRSRAAFKLIEIHNKFKLIPKDGIAIDLGSAPGSWLQVISRYSQAKVIGVDLKDVECSDIPNAMAITGDFTDDKTIELLHKTIAGQEIKLVISDMAANSCGNQATDHIRISYLAELVMDFIEENCNSGVNAVIKVIQGNRSQALNNRAKKLFKSVHWYKPKPSYSDSAEIYLVMLRRI